MKKRVPLYIAILLVVIFILSALPVYGEAEIYDDVIRLHILADSDTAEAQGAKIRVRDAIFEKYSNELRGYKTKAEAEAGLRALLPDIQATAEETLRELDMQDSVTVSLSKEQYATRVYQGFQMPAGEYLSLSVRIGRAEGQNFFCVLFPALCTDAAIENGITDGDIPVGLTPEEYKLITGESRSYRVKFKLLEVFSALFS